MEISEEKFVDLIVTPLKEDFRNLERKVDEFIKGSERKFASKLVEKLVYGLVGIVIIAVASAVVSGVIKAAEIIIN